MTQVHSHGDLETGPIGIKRGIFEGDSLSLLLFTMSLNLLSRELQKIRYCYKLNEKTKISHLFHVDDLKLYGTSDSQPTGLINTVKMVADGIKIEFGQVKCASQSVSQVWIANPSNDPSPHCLVHHTGS